jgi:hypothetical protein
VRLNECKSFCATIFIYAKKGMELNEELTVALPCDLRRKRLRLVGLLLHPISRSETWRSLSFFQALRVLPALRDPRTLLKSLADVPNWRKNQASDNLEIILETRGFLKAQKPPYFLLFLVISGVCGGLV